MGGDSGKKQCFEDFDCWTEKRDKTVGGGLDGVLSWFGERNYCRGLPDGRYGVLDK